MKLYTAIVVNNVAVLVAIATISISGFVISDTGAGLWSLLLMFALVHGKDDSKNSATKTAEKQTETTV